MLLLLPTLMLQILLCGDRPAAGAAAEVPAHFENDIEPILSRHGCNSSGCHGKAEGQGGFKLSVFAFDPVADFASIVKDGRGRRIMPTAPDESLLLRKASGRVPHGGGIRLKPDHPDYRALRAWIGAGMPPGDPNAPRVASLRIEPAEKILAAKASQPLKVLAKFTDGQERDVTRHARFQVNREGLAGVSADGVVTVLDTPGEVTVMAAYLGEVGSFHAIVPRSGPTVRASKLPQFNVVDVRVDAKLAKLNIAPSPVCDDGTFLRRATLDLNGRLPDMAEARSFLADSSPDKRSKLVDALLARPEFADVMTLKWADVLRVDRQALGHERARAFHRWIRESFASNMPFDRFAREIVAAEGPLAEIAPANFYKAVPKPGEMASTLSQVFLGVRIACAECHHHPYDRWSQTDYAAMVAFFAPLSVRGAPASEFLLSRGESVAKHPRTGLMVNANPLGATPAATAPEGDQRTALADWMTGPSNPFFARNVANRTWAMLLGRGIVEPVDDVRATNPPSNPELLDALASHLVETKYDLRSLVRLICVSRVYQTSSAPNETNEADEFNFSRGQFRRLDAEVLLDAIAQATGVPERFAGMPAGTKAVQLWDSRAKHDFLRLFGRPQRATACECERVHEPNTGQVLNLLNSPDLQRRLSHEGGAVAESVRRCPDDAKLVEELYLALYSRLPTPPERDAATNYLRKRPDARRAAAEDLAWAMLNSLEFPFNH